MIRTQLTCQQLGESKNQQQKKLASPLAVAGRGEMLQNRGTRTQRRVLQKSHARIGFSCWRLHEAAAQQCSIPVQ
jgi:hypothetical protein